MFVNYRDVESREDISLDTLRICVPSVLDDVGLRNAAGCVGYAAKKHSGMNIVNDPYDVSRVNGCTYFTVDLDGDKYIEDRDEFIDDLEDYLTHGSPIRLTNRAGVGTQGTRLVNGTGEFCDILVNTPEEVLQQVVVTVNGKEIMRHNYMAETGNETNSLIDVLDEYISILQDRR